MVSRFPAKDSVLMMLSFDFMKFLFEDEGQIFFCNFLKYSTSDVVEAVSSSSKSDLAFVRLGLEISFKKITKILLKLSSILQ